MSLSTKLNFIIILIIVLVIIKLFNNSKQENFANTNCSLIKDNYSQCYDSGDCTIMLDLKGNSFCTNKN